MAVSGTSRRRGQKECKEKTVRELKRHRQASEFLRYKRRHRFGDLGDTFATRADTVAAGTVRAGSSARSSSRTRSDQPPRRASSWRRAWLRSRVEEAPPVLQPEELRLIAHAFAVATSTAPFRADTSAPADAEAGDDVTQEGTLRPPSALITSMRALQSVLHALGIWMGDAALRRALCSAELAQKLDATGLTLQGVCDVVAEVKKTLHDPKERDADVLEAYVGLGGNTNNLSEGGISASQLHAFTKAAGFPPFNEKAKIVNQLGDVEEGENDEEEAALTAAAASAHTAVSPTSHLIEALVPAEGGVRRFRVAAFAAIATLRLHRSLTPWFLQAKPRSPRAQEALTRPKLRTEFFPAARWTGRRHGYFFTRGLLGLGYYLVRTELPSFHDAQAAARNYVKSRASSHPLEEPEIPKDYPDDDPDAVPSIRMLRYRTALGKQLLQDTVRAYLAEAEAKAAATPPPGPSSSDDAGEGGGDAATAGHGVDAAAAAAAAAAAEAEQESHTLRLTANSGPHTFAPSVPDGEAERKAFHVESGIFGEERLRCATGPPRLNQKQPVGYPPAAIVLLSAVCAAVDKPSSPSSPAPAAAIPEAADAAAPSPRHGKVTGFAPLTEHAVFKDFQQARVDMVGVPSRDASNAWLGAAHVSKASRTGWRPMSGLDEGRESGKRLSTLMREVVFQVMGDTKATKMEAMWKRQRTEQVDCGWLAWKQGLEELEFEGSEVVSRTYTDRADELLDQYDPAWAEEWEAPTDPEMGHRLGRFAGDLGLRTEVEEVQVQQDGYEQLSELSDLQTDTEHIISFEVFAAFFDRFRVYKSHRHVGQFTLGKRARPKEQKSFRATLHERILAETASQASPRAAFRRTTSARRHSTVAGRRGTVASASASGGGGGGAADAPTASEEGLPVTPGPPLLVTAHGSVVEPWRRLRYRHTPRRERGSSTLLKGCSRFMPFDWTAAQADVGRLGSGQRGFDTSQTTFVRVALQAYRFGDRGYAEEADGDPSPSPLFAPSSSEQGEKVVGEAEKTEEEEEPATTAETAAALPEHPSWAEAEEAVARLQRTVRRQDEETGAAQQLRNALFVEYAEAVGGGGGGGGGSDEKRRAEQKKGAQAPVPPDLLAEVAALNAAVRGRLEAEACKERPTLPTYRRSVVFAPAEGTAAAAAEAAAAAAATTAAQSLVPQRKRHLSALSLASMEFSTCTYVDDEADVDAREFDNGATEVGTVLRERERDSTAGSCTAEVAEKLAMLQRMRPRRCTQSSVTSLPAASRSMVRRRRGGGSALCAPPPGSPRGRSAASPRRATVARRTRKAAQSERERQSAAAVAAKRARIKQRAAEAAAAAGEAPSPPRRDSCASPQLVVSAAAHRIAVEGMKGKSVPGEADIFYRRRPLPPREKRPEGREEPDCGGGGLLVGVDVDVEIDAAALRREEHSAEPVSPCLDVCTPVPPASAPPAPFSRRGFSTSPVASTPAPRAEPSPEAVAAAASAAAHYRVHLPTASDARRRAEDGFAQHLRRTYLTPSPSSQKTQKARRAVGGAAPHAGAGTRSAAQRNAWSWTGKGHTMTASDGQLATLGGRLKQLKENMKHHDAASRASGSVSAADDVRPLSSNLSARSGRDTLHSRTSQQPQPQPQPQAQQPAMSAEESEGWIQALLNCDDVSAAVEEMTHVRNVSPIRGHRSTSTAARQSYVPASPLARQQGGRKPVLPASDYGVKPQQQQRRPAEQQAQPRQQSAFVAAPLEPHRSASPPASAADDALDKAAKIMSDLQHLAAWTGYDASQALPPPPKGVALPAPVTTLLPQQQPPPPQQQQQQPFQHQQQPLPPPQAPAFQASLPDPLGSARQPRPLEPGAYNPRYTDSPAEDKWLRSAQQLRGRSLDHPERGRSAGQQSASSRLPSPSPASLAEAPPVNRPSAVPPSPGHAAWELDPKQPVWDGRGGSRAGGSVASDFNATPNGLDELTARTGRSSAPHGAPRLNGGVGGVGGSVGGASNVDGRLAAPPISGPGSRAESPAGGGLGPRSSSQSSRATRTDLQTRLTQQKADIRSAIDTEFRMHESNVKSLLQGVTDSARNTPLPPALDPPVENKRKSPPRSRASSVNRPPRPLDAATPVPRAPVHDTPVSVHLSPSGRDESVSAISDSRLDHRFAPPAQAGHATPSTTTLLQHSDPTTAHADGSALPSAGPGGGPGGSGASATGSATAALPRDDWLTKPLQDPYGNEAGLRADSLASGPPPAGAPLPPPAPVAAATASGQSQARAPSPARWGSRDPPDSLPTGTHTSVVPLARAPSPAASNRSPTGMSMAGASPLLRPGSPGTIPVADGLGSPRREYPDEFNLIVLIDGELGAGVAIRARHSDSIATLKAKVQENRPSIPLEQQRLLYQGREMEDSLKVCDYALGEATPLQLLLKPLGSASQQADDDEADLADADAAAAPVEDPNKGKQVWLTTKGNGGVVKITVAKGDREGELMYRAKRKLNLSPDKDYHAVANGRRVRLSHENVKEGFVYTLEEAPAAADAAASAAAAAPPLPAARSGSNGTGAAAEGGLDYRGTTTTPQSLGPAADPLLPPPAPPQSGAYRLRQLYGSIQKDPVTRGDVHEALMRAAGSLDQILNVDDSLPADADVRRTLAAFAGDPRQPVRFAALVREVMSHQARCELAEECWDDQKPWQLVSVGSAVVPVDTIPAKHRYLLDMGVGRVVALNFTVVSAQKPAIPVARVLFRSGTQDATEWVKLMNLRAAKGPVSAEAPQMPPTTSLGITASTATSRVPQAQQQQPPQQQLQQQQFQQQQQQQQQQHLQQQHLQQQQFQQQQQPMTPRAAPQTLPPPDAARQGRPGSRPTSPLSVYRAASPGGGRSPVRGQTPTGQNASRGTTPDGRGRSRGTLASQTLASLRVRSRSASAGERQPNQQMSNLMAQVLEKRRMQQGSVAAGPPPQHYQRMPSGGRGSQASGRPPQQPQGAMQPQRVRSVSRNRMNP